MKYRCEQVAGDWIVRLDDGTELTWSGFTTGPVVLDDAQITAAAGELLGMTPEEVSVAARTELVPHVAEPGRRPPAVLLHSATQTTRGFEGDLTDVQFGRMPYDVTGYLEARVISLAAPGDIAVGRHEPWREAAQLSGVPAIDLGDTDHYYLSHALLVAALRGAPEMAELISWLAARPDAVVRLYALDLETQIVMVWLRRMAGLDTLNVDANAPVIAAEWNRKNGLHPTVAAALELDVDGLPVRDVLAREQRASDAWLRLGMEIPVLPGYRIERGPDAGTFAAELVVAADLLRRRHGLTLGCLKPCEAGDGARIVPGVDLADRDALVHHARDAHRHGDDYLLEAYVQFRRFTVRGREFIVAPSGHIRGGYVADGLTVQLMHGCSWEGNVLFDERTAGDLGIGPAAYAEMMTAMHTVRDAFYGPHAEAEGCHRGLVTGGVDFAFGEIGGHHGDGDAVAVIDLNLSSHGAEYLRAFHAAGSDSYVATRVFRPALDATLAATAKVVREAAAGERVSVIACTPGRWGMIATSGPDTTGAAAGALRLIDVLTEHGIASLP